MGLAKNTPPASNPHKAKYLFRDLKANEKVHEVKLNVPTTFPQNTMKVQRILTAIQVENDGSNELLILASRAFWKLLWQDNHNVDQDNLILKYLTDSIGQDKAEYFVSKSQSSVTKELLTSKTNMAFEKYGAFGAPWIVVKVAVDGKESQQVFWGSDRMELIASFLKKPYLGIRPRSAL